MASVYDWSLAAADNATADDAINWAEGQPPSSVNNSARAMMQRLREFIADLGGVSAAAGSANALAVQSHAAITAYKDGIIVRFRAIGQNDAQTSLNLNHLGAKPVLKAGLQKSVPLEGGELQAGGIYECVYNVSLANGGGWFLTSPAFIPPKPAEAPPLPAGAIAPFACEAAPAGWLKCNGEWRAQSDYPALYAAIGKRFGGDATRFALPDLRGEFIRGWADNRDLPGQKGRQLGSGEGAQLGFHRHRGRTDDGGNHAHGYRMRGFANADGGDSRGMSHSSTTNATTDSAGIHNHSFTTDAGISENGNMGDETRPRNIALLYCIKC